MKAVIPVLVVSLALLQSCTVMREPVPYDQGDVDEQITKEAWPMLNQQAKDLGTKRVITLVDASRANAVAGTEDDSRLRIRCNVGKDSADEIEKTIAALMSKEPENWQAITGIQRDSVLAEAHVSPSELFVPGGARKLASTLERSGLAVDHVLLVTLSSSPRNRKDSSDKDAAFTVTCRLDDIMGQSTPILGESSRVVPIPSDPWYYRPLLALGLLKIIDPDNPANAGGSAAVATNDSGRGGRRTRN